MKIQEKNSTNYNDLLYLKQVLKIIFKYHKNKKTIMFLGAPTKIINKYKKKIFKTKHIFISQKYWIKGLLTNKSTFIKGLSKKKLLNFKNLYIQKYLMKKKKPNLLLIFDHKNKQEILIEAAKLKIPVISFIEESKANGYISYPIILNKKNKVKYNNLIFYLLNPLLAKN